MTEKVTVDCFPNSNRGIQVAQLKDKTTSTQISNEYRKLQSIKGWFILR